MSKCRYTDQGDGCDREATGNDLYCSVHTGLLQAITPQSPPAGDELTYEEAVETYPFYHQLWAIVDSTGYPSVEVDFDRLCKFIADLLKESHCIDNAYILAQVKELETPAYPETMEYVAMVKKAQENGKYDDMYENGWKAAIAAAQARFGAGEGKDND